MDWKDFVRPGYLEDADALSTLCRGLVRAGYGVESEGPSWYAADKLAVYYTLSSLNPEEMECASYGLSETEGHTIILRRVSVKRWNLMRMRYLAWEMGWNPYHPEPRRLVRLKTFREKMRADLEACELAVVTWGDGEYKDLRLVVGDMSFAVASIDHAQGETEAQWEKKALARCELYKEHRNKLLREWAD